MLISNRVVDFLNAALSTSTAASAGENFFRVLRPFGVRALFARGYGAAEDAPAAEHVLARVSPPGWEAIYADATHLGGNYLVRELPFRSKPFLWSDIKLLSPEERAMAQTLKDCGFPNGMASPCHGPMGYVGVVSLAFERIEDISPIDTGAIEVASVILHNRMRDLAFPVQLTKKALTTRERDCIGFVANGRTDGQIADLLSISNTTVITHIENAKRKLGARTRAQAVAYCLLRNLL